MNVTGNDSVKQEVLDSESTLAYANALALSVAIMAKICDAKIGTNGLDIAAINNGIMTDMLLNGGVK